MVWYWRGWIYISHAESRLAPYHAGFYPYCAGYQPVEHGFGPVHPVHCRSKAWGDCDLSMPERGQCIPGPGYPRLHSWPAPSGDHALQDGVEVCADTWPPQPLPIVLLLPESAVPLPRPKQITDRACAAGHPILNTQHQKDPPPLLALGMIEDGWGVH